MTELMKQESRLMTAVNHASENAYTGDVEDILIPKLLIGQAISEVVQTQMVGNGEIYKSSTKKSVGGNGKPIAVIPLTMSKNWTIFKEKDGVFKFLSREPHTAANAKAEWDWIENGVKFKRVKSLDFFVLIKDEIERDIAMRKEFEETGEFPDLDDVLLPALISFQSTSYATGRTLATHFAKASEFDAPGYIKFFLLDSELVKGDKGRYGVFRLSPGKQTDKEARDVCKKWKDIVSGGSVKVDEGVEETQEFSPGREESSEPLEEPQF